MLRSNKFYLVIVAFLLVHPMFGQNYLKKAQKQLELQSYDLAIENYSAVLDDAPNNAEAILGLAKAYNKKDEYIIAIRNFEKYIAINGELPSENILDYAGLLKKVGLYDKSQIWYWKYKMVDSQIGDHYGLSCDYAKDMLQSDERYEISLSALSSKASDFSVSFFKGNQIVCSKREDIAIGLLDHNGVYQKDRQTGNISSLDLGFSSNELLSSISVSKNSQVIAFAPKSNSDAPVQLNDFAAGTAIYLGFADGNGKFPKTFKFPYNSAEYSNVFPSLGYDGSALYFSSDRLGGEGGLDIYVSYFRKGEWSEPKNLGPSINTKGNEITPFFDGETLYFSSDYTHGLGGYDVFSSTVEEGKWSFPENLGKGVNSPGDDYFFTVDTHTGTMLLTSNRIGGRGKEDIYMAREVEMEEIAYNDDNSFDDNVYIPKAVSLADINPVKRALNNNIANKYDREKARNTNLVTVSSSKTSVKEINSGNKTITLTGAKRVNIGEVVNTAANVFFIQLASLSQSSGDINKYATLTRYGSLYKVYRPYSTKVKLGYYLDRVEATSVLRSVRNAGFRDAFISTGSINGSDIELVTPSSSYSDSSYNNNSGSSTRSSSSSVTSAPSGNSKYKVRLATYDDPMWFDTSVVSDIGKIEQWTKGEWTIFVMSGFSNFDEANQAKIKSINRGFPEAEVVIDNNGILERIISN